MSDENRQTMHCLSKDTLIDMIHDLGTKFAQAHRAGWEQAKREITELLVHRHNCMYRADGSAKHMLDIIDGCVEAIATMEYKGEGK